jgi:putative phage-type endonuclease
MLTLHNVEQRTKEWHALRSGLITASSAGKLLTSGKETVLNQEPIPDNYWLQRGRILEKDALEVYSKIRDVDVLEVGFVTNSDYPGCGASPDGIVDGLIEIKCFSNKKHLSIDKDNIPFDTMAQIQFSLMVCELDYCDLVLYNPDVETSEAFKVVHVFRDEKIITNIEKKLYKQ